jgi:putative ABC transport system substrate-binding protein
MAHMKRREFITLIGTAAAWPLAARAQQGERMRRVGVLISIAADDPESQRRMTGFVQGLQELGWTDGRNVRGGRAAAPGNPHGADRVYADR